MRGRGRELADHRILRGGLHQLREIVRRGHVVGGESRGIGEVRARHAERHRLAVHRGDERRRAAGIMARQRRRRAILRRHQCQPQHFAPRQRRAHAQSRAAALQEVEILGVDVQHLVHRLLGVEHHHGGHQLGERRDGCHVVGRLRVEATLRGSVVHHHVRRAEAQLAGVERVPAGMGYAAGKRSD